MSEIPTVTINETPVTVTISDDTPIVTITDHETLLVTVIDAVPEVVLTVDGEPQVIVNTGVGGAYDATTVLASILDQVSIEHLDLSLTTDINDLRDLLTQINNQLVLTYPDGLEILETAQTFTETSISTVAADITILDGNVDTAVSQINQTAQDIAVNVTHLESIDESLVFSDSRITLTEGSIDSAVTRLESLDGPVGTVTLQQTLISQSASAISLVAQNLQSLADGAVSENAASIVLNTDLIGSYVTQLNEITGTLNSASSELTATSAITQLTALDLNDVSYSLTATQEMLIDKWSVTISEGSGNPYVTGFALTLYLNWRTGGSDYAIGDRVYYESSAQVFECILAHTPDANNSPGSTGWATYWVLIGEAEKTEFIVQADKFIIQTPDGVDHPVFTVTGNSVNVNTDLVVVSLTSQNYGQPGESWFKLDPVSGSAEFNNMTMTFSSSASKSAAQGALNVADGADVTSANTAQGIAGQGALATQDIASYLTQVSGGPPVDADNTAAMLGADPPTIANNANLGATFTSAQAKALAYLDSLAGITTGMTIISGGKIATDLVTSNSILARSIVASDIAANTLTSYEVGTNLLIANSANIGTGVISSANIGDAQITSANIGSLAVDTLNIADFAVTTSSFQTGTNTATTPLIVPTGGAQVFLTGSVTMSSNAGFQLNAALSPGGWTTLYAATILGGTLASTSYSLWCAAGYWQFQVYTTAGTAAAIHAMMVLK